MIFKQGVEPFRKKWSDSRVKDAKGRAERCLKGAPAECAAKFIHTVILAPAMLDLNLMDAECQPAVFGVSKGNWTVKAGQTGLTCT